MDYPGSDPRRTWQPAPGTPGGWATTLRHRSLVAPQQRAGAHLDDGRSTVQPVPSIEHSVAFDRKPGRQSPAFSPAFPTNRTKAHPVGRHSNANGGRCSQAVQDRSQSAMCCVLPTNNPIDRTTPSSSRCGLGLALEMPREQPTHPREGSGEEDGGHRARCTRRPQTTLQ